MNPRKMVSVAFTLLLSTVSVIAVSATEIPVVSDGFESRRIDTSKWQLFQIKSGRHRRDRTYVRTGRGSRAIHAQEGDIGMSCEKLCQRSEIRLVNALRAPYSQDVYYGFSFQVRDDVSKTGSNRLVIGQWKGTDSGGSPFLAQRFDNRVFHVTVQDNDCRLVVASAKGDIDAFLQHQRDGDVQKLKLEFLADRELYICVPQTFVECFVENCRLPDPYKRWTDMVYRVKGGRNHDGEVTIWADGEKIAQITGQIGNDDDGDRQKFKFGIYRDDIDELTTIYFDNFRQGASFDAVDPATFSD